MTDNAFALPPLPLGIGAGAYFTADQIREYGKACALAAFAMQPSAAFEPTIHKAGAVPEVPAWEYYFIHSSATGHGEMEVGPCLTYDKNQAFGIGCIKQREVRICSLLEKPE